ncbi:MAG: hypothetical protein JNL85_09890 [Rubrivivax sp.]|nr:hypothetical protein [Rubrivivax sp.]
MIATTEPNERAGPLAGLVTLAEHQQQRARFFPSEDSLRWHVRQHRQALTDAGAVLFIGGRLWINADKFDAFVIAAGEAAAKRRAVAA